MSLGDSLRGLLFRYRASYEEWCSADLSRRSGKHENPAALREATTRLAAAAEGKSLLERQILQRMREGGAEINALLEKYNDETGR